MTGNGKPMLSRWADFPGNDKDSARAELARLYVEMEDLRTELRHLAGPGQNNGEVRESETDVLDNVIRGYEAALRRLHPDLRTFAFDEAWARALLGLGPRGGS